MGGESADAVRAQHRRTRHREPPFDPGVFLPLLLLLRLLQFSFYLFFFCSDFSGARDSPRRATAAAAPSRNPSNIKHVKHFPDDQHVREPTETRHDAKQKGGNHWFQRFWTNRKDNTSNNQPPEPGFSQTPAHARWGAVARGKLRNNACPPIRADWQDWQDWHRQCPPMTSGWEIPISPGWMGCEWFPPINLTRT